MKFCNYGFKDYIMQGITELGFIEATPIQELIIPKVLKKESLIGKSATGTGKTHAFLLPILQMIDSEKKEVQAVIISPTRELASQLFEEVIRIVKYNNEIDAKMYIGGTNRDSEIAWLEKRQPQIVVSTIGKLEDLALSTNVLKIHTAKVVVIDEADMVFNDADFIEVDNIFCKFNKDVQTLVFSATISNGLSSFLNKYLSGCPTYDLTNREISKSTITHVFIPTKNKNKLELLYALLQTFSPYLVLIFANTKETVNEVANFLATKGMNVTKLTGELEARERKQVLKRIKDGQIQYVVASDLASRGMDIEGVSHVINYELPNEIEYYIHRAGRTARYEQTGTCISFYDFSDDNYLHSLEKKGLNCCYKTLKNGELVTTVLRERMERKSSVVKRKEAELHSSIPVPKKVKPGYKKKRLEEIEKQLKKFKKQRIHEMYRKKNGKAK